MKFQKFGTCGIKLLNEHTKKIRFNSRGFVNYIVLPKTLNNGKRF